MANSILGVFVCVPVVWVIFLFHFGQGSLGIFHLISRRYSTASTEKSSD